MNNTPLPFAETLSDEKRRHYRNTAIGSTLLGCISSQLVENGAVIVLFLTLLGGSESFAMFSSSLMSLSGIFLLIPCAAFAAKCGIRITYSISCIAGFLGFCLIAAAPYCGTLGKYAVITGCSVYTLTLNFYSSTWYPLLDNFLRKEERTAFFSRMRFIYMLFNAGLLFLLGKCAGSNTPVWAFQLLFLLAGAGLLGRKICMDHFPLDPAMQRESADLRKTLPICLHNRPLMGFSIYLCCLYMTFSAALPMTMIYMKNTLHIATGTIVILSSVNLLGKLTGFFLLGKTGRYCSMRTQILFTHILALLSVGALVFLSGGGIKMLILAGSAFFFLGTVNALLMCINAVGILELAVKGNKLMAMAVCSTLVYIGTAAGTLLTTFLLKEGVIKNIWILAGKEFSKFQLLAGAFFLGIFLCFLLLPFVPGMSQKMQNNS